MQNADYLVVVELLSYPDGRSPDLLKRSLAMELETLDATLESLEQHELIVRHGNLVRLSDAVRRLDQLNLIAV